MTVASEQVVDLLTALADASRGTGSPYGRVAASRRATQSQRTTANYGAIVTVKVAGRVLLRHCHTDGSYLSASDARVHFGIGSATQIEEITVRWPDGHRDILRNVTADSYRTIREGDRNRFDTAPADRTKTRVEALTGVTPGVPNLVFGISAGDAALTTLRFVNGYGRVNYVVGGSGGTGASRRRQA